MSTVIAVVNESKDITDRQARLMTKACHIGNRNFKGPFGLDRKVSKRSPEGQSAETLSERIFK